MRQAMSVAFLITAIGVIWFLLALATNDQSGDWLVGLFIALVAGAGLIYGHRTAEANFEIQQRMEMVEAIRRGLYK